MARDQTYARNYPTNMGQALGIAEAGNVVTNGKQATSPCVDASITVSAEGASVANQRDIAIQLKDAEGRDIDYVEEVEIGVFLDAGRLAYVVTGGSTGIAIGTDGALLALVAKKRFVATSEADGDIDLTWTDTGTEVAFLGVRLPTGRWVMSSALTNA